MKFFFLLVVTLMVNTIVTAQSPLLPKYRSFTDTDFIRTNPSNPYPNYNTQTPWKTNTFEWRQQFIPYKNTIVACRSGVSGFLNSIDNYFWGTIPQPEHSTRKGVNSDFQPVDGWELIQRDFGYRMKPGQMSENEALSLENGQTTRISYVVLYNRYTGVLRVMATPLSSPPSNNKMIVKVSLRLNPSKDNASALLQQVYNETRALDKVTITEAQMATTTPALQCDAFFMADFQMSYDPCNCKTLNNLGVDFSYVDVATFTATGLGLGVSKDLKDFIGTNPPEYVLPQFSEKYFNSIFHNNKPAGTFFYQSASSAMKMYENKTATQDDLSKAFKLVGKVLSVGAKAAGLYSDEEEIKKYIKALELLSGVTDFASMVTEQSKPSIAPLTIMESEIRLKGEITSTAEDLVNNVRIVVPGSLGSDNAPELRSSIAHAYPTYNETMGLFAVKKSAAVSYLSLPRTTLHHGTTHNSFGPVYNCSILGEQIKFNLDTPLEFYLNPASGVDLSKTKIRAAIQFTFTILNVETRDQKDLPQSFINTNIRFLGRFVRGDSVSYVFTTPFVSPSCLNQLTASLVMPNLPAQDYSREFPRVNYRFVHDQRPYPWETPSVEPPVSFSVKLKFINQYVFKITGTESPRSTTQILTFPVSLTRVSGVRNNQGVITSTFADRPLAHPFDLTLPKFPFPGQTNTTVNCGTKTAWNNIYIRGPLSHSCINGAEIIAGNSIEFSNEATITPNIRYTVGNFAALGCPASDGHIADVASRQAFCESNDYKANLCIGCTREGDEETDPTREKAPTTTLYPNPTGNDKSSTLCFDKEQDMGGVELALYDPIGRRLSLTYTAEGASCLRLQLPQETASGVYILQLRGKGGWVSTKKLIVP